MHDFLLDHRHRPDECEAAFAAWCGFESPLRGRSAPSTCLMGDHRIWWWVRAQDEHDALSWLPDYVARRTDAVRTRPVDIP